MRVMYKHLGTLHDNRTARKGDNDDGRPMTGDISGSFAGVSIGCYEHLAVLQVLTGWLKANVGNGVLALPKPRTGA